MRIQHNIMAMSAYRNYNTNTSALAKNLEKLSSGYKINRAGDDAAGLAISEKMRAQITGLEAASKNVKDGISLVKTAEGAMQEIQDMLNRMDYLATQSANGTYQDEVDRENLNKEMMALKTEIDRIADSANFNGIKLLDGSLDPTHTVTEATEAAAGEVTSLVSSTVGETLGTSTVLHKGGNEASVTEFGVDLHEVTFANEIGQVFELTIGSDTFTLEGDGTGEMSAADLADAFKGGDFVDAAGNATNGTVTVNGGTFTVDTDGTRITFEQDDTEDPVSGDLAVTVGGSSTAEVTTAPANTAVSEDTQPAAAAKGKYSYDFASAALTAGTYDVEIAGQKVSVTLSGTAGNAPTAAELASAVKDELDNLTFEDGVGGEYQISVTGTKIEFEASAVGADATPIAGTLSVTASADTGVKGDYNVTTTVTNDGLAAGDKRIASGVVTLTKDNFADGTVFQIGEKQYTVTTDESKKSDTGAVYVGDLDVTSADGLKTAIDRLTVAADDNGVWTLGHGTTAGQVTFAEKVDEDGKTYMDGTSPKYDLTKEADIKASFGTVGEATEAAGAVMGKGLNLQIGDTSDPFNQMEVVVGDMHVNAMGTFDKDGNLTKSIEDIDILTSENAQKAVDVIKNAINYVSGVRGDLGAYQNRLEHTANNLSVMRENIQDAESTIRDTDIAEEMMSYTKNNILVQSAQAMLAQANAVPQGVLQLLG